jgi:hypothetical protein
MAGSNDELQNEVNEAVAGGDQDAPETAADDDGAASGDESAQEDTSTSENRGNGSADESDEGDSDTEVDDFSDDEEDDDDFDPFRSNATAVAPQQGGVKQPSGDFDIRKLPRDADGNIDVVEANKVINQWHSDQITNQSQESQRFNEIRENLTKSWDKGLKKFPHIAKNRKLARLANRIHQSSVVEAKDGRGKFISPYAAMREVDAMYQSAVRSAAKQHKTRRTVERTATVDAGGNGKSNAKEASSEYAKAKKLSESNSPTEAAEGRRMIIRLRRAARQSK